MNVNELMNMNDMYYVGNIVDVDGNGWVTKQEAQAILDELGISEEAQCGGAGPHSYIHITIKN